MSWYGVFLARVPPGSPRGGGWYEKAHKFPCAGFPWGDYDLHGLIRLGRTLPFDETAEILELAPDHHLSVICPIPGEPDPALDPKAWAALSQRHPLFCYAEIDIRPEINALGGIGKYRWIAKFAQDVMCRYVEDSKFFLSLSATTFVAYLFGNSIDDFFSAVLDLRSKTVNDLKKWLHQTSNKSDEVTEFLSQLEELGLERHICRSSYTLYGSLPIELPNAPLTSDDISDMITRRISTKPAGLKPILFISTVPGHETANKELRKLLAENSATGNTLVLSAGLFDMIHIPYPFHSGISLAGVDLQGSNTLAEISQRDLAAKTTRLLFQIWDLLGPENDRAAVLRTNTVWVRAEATGSNNEYSSTGPRSVRPSTRRKLFSSDPLGNISAALPEHPAAKVLAVLDSTIHALERNRLSSAYEFVQDIDTFLEQLSAELEHSLSAGNAPDQTTIANHHDILRVVDDALARIGATLTTRTYCTSHALREEIAVLPGASFHKIIATYGGIMRALGAHIAKQLGVAMPTFLCALGGVYPARSHTYFNDSSGRPRLVIYEVAGTSVLDPARAVFGLAHELMHIVAADPSAPLLGYLARPLLEEAAAVIALEMTKLGGDIADASLENGIAAVLLGDYADEIRESSLNTESFFIASTLVGLLRTDVIYLAQVIEQARRQAEGRQMSLEDFGNYEAVRYASAQALALLVKLFTECFVDTLTAFTTHPDGYLHTLRGEAGRRIERIDIAESVLFALASVAPSPAVRRGMRPLIRGLIDVAQSVTSPARRLTDESLREFFEYLGDPGKNQEPMNEEELRHLLRYLEVLA